MDTAQGRQLLPREKKTKNCRVHTALTSSGVVSDVKNGFCGTLCYSFSVTNTHLSMQQMKQNKTTPFI